MAGGDGPGFNGHQTCSMCDERMLGCCAGRHGTSGRFIPGWCSVSTRKRGEKTRPRCPSGSDGLSPHSALPGRVLQRGGVGWVRGEGSPQGPVYTPSSAFSGCWRCLGTSATCLLSVCLGDVAAREGDVQYQGLLFTKQVAWFWRHSAWILLRGVSVPAFSSVLLAPHC